LTGSSRRQIAQNEEPAGPYEAAPKKKGIAGEPPITLFMPDGRTETLRGGGDYLGDLVSRAVYGAKASDVELLARSVSSIEPGGGRMLELERAILNSPAE
jgi:hypothetical protein